VLQANTSAEGSTGHIGVGSWNLFIHNAGADFKECVSDCSSQVQFEHAESVALKQQLVQCTRACQQPSK